MKTHPDFDSVTNTKRIANVANDFIDENGIRHFHFQLLIRITAGLRAISGLCLKGEEIEHEFYLSVLHPRREALRRLARIYRARSIPADYSRGSLIP